MMCYGIINGAVNSCLHDLVVIFHITILASIIIGQGQGWTGLGQWMEIGPGMATAELRLGIARADRSLSA